MAADDHGTKNEPIYSGSGAPSDAADLTEVAAYAAAVGNRKTGTTTQRNALTGNDVWEGLEFEDQTLDVTFVRRNGRWVAIDAATAGHFARTSGNTSDQFPNETMAQLAGGTITNAPPGAYIVYGAVELSTTATSAVGTIRIGASNPSGGKNPVPDSQRATTSAIRGETVMGLFIHSGGNLAVTISAQVNAGNGVVQTNGTYVGAFRVGS